MNVRGYVRARPAPHGVVRSDLTPPGAGPANLADILERVLDKGIVIAGDIQINLLDIELLTIKIRLLIASVDRAREMGINWWENDSALTTGGHDLEKENRELRARSRRVGPATADERHRLRPRRDNRRGGRSRRTGQRGAAGRV